TIEIEAVGAAHVVAIGQSHLLLEAELGHDSVPAEVDRVPHPDGVELFEARRVGTGCSRMDAPVQGVVPQVGATAVGGGEPVHVPVVPVFGGQGGTEIAVGVPVGVGVREVG